MWKPFKKSPPAPAVDAAWWREASALAASPTAAAIAALEQRAGANQHLEDADRQREMIAGLHQLAEIAAQASLPAVRTQHRVIGQDTCHFIGPASRVAESDSSGKLFLTSTRLVLVTGAVASWPWHRVTSVARIDRDVLFSVSGAEPVQVRLNTFGEALIVHFLAERILTRRPASHGSHTRI